MKRVLPHPQGRGAAVGRREEQILALCRPPGFFPNAPFGRLDMNSTPKAGCMSNFGGALQYQGVSLFPSEKDPLCGRISIK